MPELPSSATGYSGYFCVSAVSDYAEGSGLKRLEEVYAEAATVRSALRDLGLEELFRSEEGEQTHSELRAKLADWAQRTDTEDELPERNITLVIYCTGHGYLDPAGHWYLVPPDCLPVDPDRYTRPSSLLWAVHVRKDLAQVILILDACFAGDGADQAFNQTFQSTATSGSEVDVWVIAAARRTEPAAPNVFAPALASALQAAAGPSWRRAFLDLEVVGKEVADHLAHTQQHAQAFSVHDLSGCRALPNPRFMPPTAPAWLTPPWSPAARGVRAGSEPGWFFVSREPAWSDLLGFVSDRAARPTVLVLRGSRGCGKSALLARLVTSATATLRQAMPMVTRSGGLPGADLTVAAVDARDLSVSEATNELALSFGSPAGSPAALIAALTDARQPVVVVIDHLDRAVDPGQLMAAVVEPLRQLPMVSLVVAARHGELPDPADCQIVDLDDPAEDGAAAVERYLTMRLGYGSEKERGRLADRSAATRPLARACGGNFSAAVTAADTFLAASADGRSPREALDAAIMSAAKQADRFCRQALENECRVRAAAAFPEAFADALASTLSALCSYTEDAALPLPTWTKVAERVSGLQLRSADVEECARRAVPFLSLEQDGQVIRCRPSYDRVPGPSDPAPADIIRHLLAVEAPESSPGWRCVDPGVMAILAGAAAQPAGGASQLLDKAGFLLAAPDRLVTHTLKALPDRKERVRRGDVWRMVPPHGAPYERAFILALRAAQADLVQLTASCEPASAAACSATVQWARRNPGRHEYPVIGLAVADQPDPASALTAASDGTLTWWDTRSGERGSQLLPVRDGTTIRDREVHAATVRGMRQAVTVSADGRVHRWTGGSDRVAIAGLQAHMAAFHRDGLLAAATDQGILVVAADDSITARLSLPPGSVRAMSFVGPADHPIMWILGADGTVRRWEPGHDAKGSVIAVYPDPLLLAASPDGAAVVIDANEKLAFPGQAGSGLALPRLATADTIAAHLSRRWLIVIGGQSDGWWMQTCDLAAGRSTRWPLDDLPVAVSGFGKDGDLLLVTRLRIAAIRLTPHPGLGSAVGWSLGGGQHEYVKS